MQYSLAMQEDGNNRAPVTPGGMPGTTASAFYDNLRENEWKDLAEIGPSLRTRDRLLLDMLTKLKPAGRFLDVGCGSGTFISLVSQRLPSLRLSGCDVSEVALDQARRKIAAEFFLMDLGSNVELDEEYETVLCSDVLEHVPDLETAIRNLSNMVSEGGYLLVSVPYLRKNWTEHDTFSGHVRRFEPGELEQELADRGFVVEESFGWGAFVYEMYYSVLKRQDPQTIMANPGSHWKRIVSNLLYHVFRIDDLFVSNTRGRRLIVLARKVGDTLGGRQR